MTMRACMAVAVLSVIGAGCAGKSVQEQYSEKAREIRMKYDAMIIPNSAKSVVYSHDSCGQFVDKMKSRYQQWRPGDAADKFCATNPSVQQRLRYEAKIRLLNNRAAAQAKARKLEALTASYRASDLAQDTLSRAPAARNTALERMPRSQVAPTIENSGRKPVAAQKPATPSRASGSGFVEQVYEDGLDSRELPAGPVAEYE